MLSDSIIQRGCVLYAIDSFDVGDGRAPWTYLLSSVDAHREFIFKEKGAKGLPLIFQSKFVRPPHGVDSESSVKRLQMGHGFVAHSVLCPIVLCTKCVKLYRI
jgi:hypothetical protein